MLGTGLGTAPPTTTNGCRAGCNALATPVQF